MVRFGILILPKASLELDESIDWYGERSQSAAINFSVALDEAIARIIENPSAHPIVFESYRQVHLRKYPFTIIY